MTRYTADEYELRCATTEAGLDTAPVLAGWESIEIVKKSGRKKSPDGIGSNKQTIHATLLDYSGSASGWYQESALAGSSDELTAFGMFQQGEETPLYVELKNKTTSSKIRLKKVLGDPTLTIDSPEGFSMWAWDFDFEDISKS